MRRPRISTCISAAALAGSCYYSLQTVTDTVHESGQIAANATKALVPDAAKALGGLAGKFIGHDDKPAKPESSKDDESWKVHTLKVVTWQERIAPEILPEDVSNDLVAGSELAALAFASAAWTVTRRRSEISRNRVFYETYAPFILQLEAAQADEDARRQSYGGNNR